MLISFSVSNFRSFGEEETLSMVASNKLSEHLGHLIPIGSTGKHVLRTAVVYGANAAGKSNLVRAMSFAQRLIIERRDFLPPFDPFRFGTGGEKSSDGLTNSGRNMRRSRTTSSGTAAIPTTGLKQGTSRT